MKNKKKLLTALILTSSLVIIVAISKENNFINNKNESKAIHVLADAKIDYYENLEQVENASDLIVIGTKLSDDGTTVERDSQGYIEIIYTMSDFKIDKIIKNNKNINISNYSTINIFENEGFDDKSNIVYHIAGYEKMKVGEKYALLLEVEPNGRYYIPKGVIYGKIPLTAKKTELFIENKNTTTRNKNTTVEENDNVENIIKNAQEKYTKVQ